MKKQKFLAAAVAALLAVSSMAVPAFAEDSTTTVGDGTTTTGTDTPAGDSTTTIGTDTPAGDETTAGDTTTTIGTDTTAAGDSTTTIGDGTTTTDTDTPAAGDDTTVGDTTTTTDTDTTGTEGTGTETSGSEGTGTELPEGTVTTADGFILMISGDSANYGVYGYNGVGGDIALPESYDGKGITFIWPGAFVGNTDITGVVGPSCMYIGENAFRNCTSLQWVEFNNAVEVYDGAFSGCTSLTKVDMDAECEYISTTAFDGCTSLGVTDGSANSGLRVNGFFLMLNGDNSRYGVVGYNGAATDIYVPACASFIGKNAFENNTYITSILANNCLGIETDAFLGCSNLKWAEFSSCKSVYAGAFAGCTNLEWINLFCATAVYENAFENCTALRQIYMGYNCDFADTAFTNCGVTGVIPYDEQGFLLNRDTDGDWYVAAYIGSGGDITLPAQAAYVMEKVFYGNNSITSVTVPATCWNCIEQYAFRECQGLKKVVFEGDIEFIGRGAFYRCFSLKEVVFGGSVTDRDGKSNGGIGSLAFIDCTNLNKVVFSNPYAVVDKIGTGAFLNCCCLASVNLPENLKYICSGAFAGCISLSPLTVPAGTRFAYAGDEGYMYGYAYGEDEGRFYKTIAGASYGYITIGGEKRVYAVAPQMIVTKGSDAEKYAIDYDIPYTYADGTSPSDTTTATPAAPTNPSTSTETSGGSVSAPVTTTTTGGTVTTYSSGGSKLKTDSSGNTYVSGSSGSKKNVTIPEEAVYVGNNAFKGNSKVKTVTVPDTCKYIGKNAFKDCKNLETVVIKGDTEIKDGAFKGCDKLTLVVEEGSPAEDYAIENNIPWEHPKLEAPSGFGAKRTESSVTLTWNATPGAEAYCVYLYNEETGKYEKYKSVSGEKCTIKDLDSGTKYKFKVVALDKKSNGKYKVGNTSKTLSVTTK